MGLNTEKLKVLFFTASLGEGGITRVILDLLKGIDRNRFCPSIAVYNTDGVRMKDLPEGVPSYPLNVQKEGRGREVFKLFWTYRRLVKKVNPEVVISSVWKPNMISLMAHVIDFSGKRKLILREDAALSPYFKDVHGGIKGKISPLLTKLLYPRADHIIAVSEGLKRESVAYGIPEGKITVIHNPLDLKTIDQRKREGIKVQKPYILFVGRLSREKNLPLLIEAYHRIRDKWDVDLLIVGKGDEEGRLRDLVKRVGIAERVFFEGYVLNPYPYMHRAQLLVLPSDYEGFSCVLLEAMACGTPVVSTLCPHGPDEIIRDGVNGFLVPMKNAARLAEAMEKILADNLLRESFIRRGWEKIQSYDLDVITRRYEQLVMEVYSKRR